MTVVEHAGVRLPYRIEEADLRLMAQTRNPEIRLHLSRENYHIGLGLPVGRLAELIQVAGADRDGAGLNDIIGRQVMVGLDDDMAVDLSNMRRPDIRLPLASSCL